MKTVKVLGILVFIAGIAAIVVGGVFIGQGIAKNNLITERMEIEQVSLALDPENPNVYTLIMDAEGAQAAADTIAEHRRNIAPTYQDLLNRGNGRFDPTNPDDLNYAQAMNLENYLYLAVLAFGLIQVVWANGAILVIIGLGAAGTGFALYRIGRAKA
jgi:hypothetical protein